MSGGQSRGEVFIAIGWEREMHTNYDLKQVILVMAGFWSITVFFKGLFVAIERIQNNG